MDSVSDSDFTYSGERQRPGLLYLVSWRGPAGRIVKAGVSDYPARWRRFVARGAELHGLWRGPEHVTHEQELHEWMALVFPPAFAEKAEAHPYLGTLGGWMECYAVPDNELQAMLEEVRLGLVQSG